MVHDRGDGAGAGRNRHGVRVASELRRSDAGQVTTLATPSATSPAAAAAAGAAARRSTVATGLGLSIAAPLAERLGEAMTASDTPGEAKFCGTLSEGATAAPKGR